MAKRVPDIYVLIVAALAIGESVHYSIPLGGAVGFCLIVLVAPYRRWQSR